MWVQSGMASSPRGWHVISSLSCLIGIWLGDTQTSLLSHPSKMNSATIKTRDKVHTFQREQMVRSKDQTVRADEEEHRPRRGSP